MRTIPELKEGTHRAKASGTLPNGKPVIVNADGTVSVIGGASESLGSESIFNSGITDTPSSAYDVNSGKVVIVYRDESNSDYIVAVVGTVSGSSISFGTEVVVDSVAVNTDLPIVYDANAQKVVVFYYASGSPNAQRAKVGTVSGTSISFGSSTQITTQRPSSMAAAYDANAQKVVYFFVDAGGFADGGYPNAIVGTVSGTSISFGSNTAIKNAASDYLSIAYDSNAQKVVACWQDQGNSNYGTSAVGTISGTSISFGTPVVFQNASTEHTNAAFDSSNNKVVLVYQEGGANNDCYVIVGTVSGTSISFGTRVQITTNTTNNHGIIYDETAQKIVITYRDRGDSNYGKYVIGEVSGTSITLETPVVFSATTTDHPSLSYDSANNKVVISYRGTSNYGRSKVLQVGYSTLTSENYIGMSQGGIVVTSQTQAIGSAVIFEDADTKYTVSTFDSVNNKIIIAYRDNNNSGYLTAIVGTVSGTSISFGTPVVAASNSSQYVGIAFNDNAGKCVISYRNASTQKALAIVGTVSGTSISFGTAAIFNNADTENTVAAYDAASQNVVIAYKDQANSSYGTAIVAVISGTSVSFGSEVVFQSTNSVPTSIVYDSGISKVIIGYKKYDSFFKGFGVVGTVSGNSISFGTPVRFDTANTSGYDVQNISLTYNSNEDKTLFASRSTDGYGQLNVATVSGTSISFAADVTFNSANTSSILSFYDSDAQAHGIAYGDTSDNFKYVTATISGTSATISSPTSISSNIGTLEGTMGAAYDTDSNKGVLAYQIRSPDSRGTTRVIQNASTTITRGQVNAGSSATVDIIGSLSTNQSGLTAGQSYYVQTDGTIGETAADPSVLAGTAISATSLVVKT